MASVRALFILGAAMTTLSLSNSSPTVAPDDALLTALPEDTLPEPGLSPIPTDSDIPVDRECRQRAVGPLQSLEECVGNIFAAAALNETREMFNDTECVPCKYLCRKQREAINCIGTAVDALFSWEEISNGSRIMISTLRQLAEEALSSFCENEAPMTAMFGNQDNIDCFRARRFDCRPKLKFLGVIEEVALCEVQNPKVEISYTEFLCTHLLEYLECTETDAWACSSEVQAGVASLISQLRNAGTCAHYF